MNDPNEDDFSDVKWDVPGAADPLQQDDTAPAVLDPLSDATDLLRSLDLKDDDAPFTPVGANTHDSLLGEASDLLSGAAPTSSDAQTTTGLGSTHDDPLTEASIDAALSSPLMSHSPPTTMSAFAPSPFASSPAAPSTSALASPPAALEPKSVLVMDPRKEVDGQQTYVSYQLVSKNATVRRRFQDFVWLYNMLYSSYPACIIPPLPDKHRMEYVKGDRFSTDFVERRRVSLERFLQRIARHPILCRSEYFIMFLESAEFNDASARALREGQETMIDSLGDSLLNAFTKIRKPDQVFIDMKDRVDRMEENFSLLEKTLARTNKRADDLAHDYVELANSVNGLGHLETNFQEALTMFAHAVHSYANQVKAVSNQDTEWLHQIHDYMAYHLSMKEVLKLRDQKQLDFEELSEYLQNTLKERDRAVHGADGNNLTGYLTGKLNEVRGADMDKIRRERVLRLDDRIRELKDAIEQSNEVSNAFSDQVKKENEYFTRGNTLEMHAALQTYANAKVDFYQHGIDTWKGVVAALEEQI
ncbi:hypothetical protein BC940DRAFT_271458 [Gongronella butleri]|nr:hypothetical protein BC940DRAFT_271458 [Gongronella butleri]